MLSDHEEDYEEYEDDDFDDDVEDDDEDYEDDYDDEDYDDEDYEDDEDDDDYDEEYDEEDEEEDDDDEEEDDDDDEEDEEEDDDEENLVDISYYDDNGVLKKERIPYTELQAMYKFAKEAPNMVERYKEALYYLNQYETDSFFASVNKYRKMGYSDDQILEGMEKLRQQSLSSKNQVAEEPEFDDVNSAVEYHVKKAIEPYVKRQQEQELQSIAMGNQTHNNQVLQAAIEEAGWEYDRVLVTPAMVEELRKAKQELFPDVELTQKRLTKAQARALIGTALGLNEQEPQETEQDDRAYRRLAKNILKQSQAPKVLSGNTNRREKQDYEDRTFTREARAKRADKLF